MAGTKICSLTSWISSSRISTWKIKHIPVRLNQTHNYIKSNEKILTSAACLQGPFDKNFAIRNNSSATEKSKTVIEVGHGCNKFRCFPDKIVLHLI